MRFLINLSVILIVAVAARAHATCADFRDFAITSGEMLTEGLVVAKDGEIQFEYYENHYTPETPHALWSVTKMITGALLGIAESEGRVSLDQKLASFFPSANESKFYGDVTLENLFYLDAGFIWDEYYAGDVANSPVINMLYGKGYTDAALYAAGRPMIADGPGKQWVYSSGTPTITMGVLKKVYGADYKDMPWKKLFGPLGMKSAAFERDSSGTFIGGSYAHAAPRDMIKLGQLYLNGGVWNGRRILPPAWIEKTLTPSPGYVSDGTVIHDITDDGVYGGSIWLNRAVKAGFGRPYPYSPEDMFFAMGHYGQLLIVLPSQNMVIARTGYDSEYNSKIDKFVSGAISCFADPAYPIGKIIPPPPTSHIGLMTELVTLESAIRADIIQAAVAKTICSCHFIGGLDVKTCVDRSHIPGAANLTEIAVKESSGNGKKEVRARLSWFATVLGAHWGQTKTAVFDSRNPQLGCTLQ